VEDANGSHWRYSRPQNSDEFNPSPNYVVVTAESASDRSIGNMLRFDNLKPINGEVIVRGYTPSGNGVGPGVTVSKCCLTPKMLTHCLASQRTLCPPMV
jgi:hypothetical protein